MKSTDIAAPLDNADHGYAVGTVLLGCAYGGYGNVRRRKSNPERGYGLSLMAER